MVKPRYDGGGSFFGMLHRRKGALPTNYYFQDIDGVIVVTANGEDKSYVDYAPDDFKNHDKLIRKIGFAAVIEYKNSTFAFSHMAAVQLALQLQTCRNHGRCQDGITPVPAIVIGNGFPLAGITYCATTGAILLETQINPGGELKFYRESGIAEKYGQLARWVWR